MQIASLEKAPKGSRLAIGTSLAPGLLLFVVFFLIAIGTLAVTAFTNWTIRGADFVGFDNFVQIFEDGRFQMAMRNTTVFVLAAVSVQVPLATLVALILARKIRGWRAIRVTLFLPNMMSGAAIGLVYIFVFNPRFGLVNGLLRVVGLDEWTRDWLVDINTAIWAVIATWVFFVGLFVILILNEIQGIPTEIQEAAQIDGAGRWQRDLWITLPLIRPVVATCMLLAVLAAFSQFENVYVMTAGGPADQTLTLGLYGFMAYSRGDWGLANAAGLLMLIMGAAFILIIRRIGRLESSDR